VVSESAQGTEVTDLVAADFILTDMPIAVAAANSSARRVAAVDGSVANADCHRFVRASKDLR
jgi:hypothetical protein